MKKILVPASAFFALALHAQITATVGRSPAGIPELRIRNDGRLSMAAFAVVLNPAPVAEDRTQFVVFLDTLIDETTPLLPARDLTLPVLRRPRPGTPLDQLFELPPVTAGVLADGTTTGDPVLLSRLLMRRNNTLLAVETAMESLTDAGSRNVPREQLIASFRRLADSLARWYVPPEQQTARTLYQSLAYKLRNLQEGPPGSPFPPSSFVAKETAELNRLRVVLLQSQPGLEAATLLRGTSAR